MKYMRNSDVLIRLLDNKVVINGGRFNKKIIGSDVTLGILKQLEKPTSDNEILGYLENTFKVNKDMGKKTLEKLMKLGFIEEDEVLKVGKLETKDDNKKVSIFAIPTCKRKFALEQCIRSYAVNFKNNGHDMEYMVFDDTPVEECQGNIEALKKASDELDINIYYVGVKEKEEFIKMLSADISVDERIIKYAFMPEKVFPGEKIFKAGANRNSILAYTVGEYLLSADDDSVCAEIEPQSEGEESVFFSSGRGDIRKNFIEYDEFVKLDRYDEFDVVKMHNEILGNSLSEVLNRRNIDIIKNTMISQDNKIFPSRYEKFKESKVHFTFNTIAGWPDETADEMLYRFLRSENEKFILGNENNMVVEKSNAINIYSEPFLLTTTLTGIDNTDALCPFFPIYRNEDIHYSYILNAIDPYILSSGINNSLLHNKKGCNNPFIEFQRNFFSDIVMSSILYRVSFKSKLKVPSKFIDRDTRVKALSEVLYNLCGDSIKEFLDNIEMLGVNLREIWEEKRKLALQVMDKWPKGIERVKLADMFISYESFLEDNEWENIRKNLILYSELIVQWKEIAHGCEKMNKKGVLPRVKISGGDVYDK